MNYDADELQGNLALLRSGQPLKQEIGFQSLRPHAHKIVEQIAEWIGNETNARTREYLAALLAEGRTPQGRSILKNLLEDTDPHIRFWANYGLGLESQSKTRDLYRPKGLGVIEGQTNVFFKETTSGWIFFPWGIWGKGYILPTQFEKQRIWGIIKRWVSTSWLIVLINPFLLLSLENHLPLIVGIGTLEVSILLSVQWFMTRHLTKGLDTSTERLTWNEAHRIVAQSYHEGVIWVLIGLSLLAEILAILGLVATFTEKAPIYVILVAFIFVIWWAVIMAIGVDMLSTKSR